MGLFGKLTKADAIADVAKGTIEGVGTAVEKIVNVARGENPALDMALVEVQKQINQGQIEVNKIEAAHTNLFVSGWRPMIGWTCAIAICYNYLLMPFIQLILRLAESEVVVPAVDITALFPLMLGMLGIAGMRTYEKNKGVNAKH